MTQITNEQVAMRLEKVLHSLDVMDQRIGKLQNQIEILKSWSDLNDHYLREMIDALDDSLTLLYDKVGELHNIDKTHKSVNELPLAFPELKEIIINKGE